MPITEKQMSHEEMERHADKGYLCAECQGSLTVAWGGSLGIQSYILRCGSNVNHEGITRHDKKYEDKVRQIKEARGMDSKALEAMNEQTMLQRVEMGKFPQDLKPEEKRLLAQVAITYGFDPLMGEVTIYQGNPFISIDGRYRKAQETGRLDGVNTRPATKQEREDWQIPDGDYFFRSEVWVKGSSRPFVGWGKVRKSETTGGKGYKPVETNPQRMAEKRAEAQALRKAFHIPLPSAEDIGSPEYDIESTGRVVNETTGEITEQPPVIDTPPEATEPPTEVGTTEVKSDAEGNLKEQIMFLQSKGLKAWTNANILGYLKNITGQEAKTPSEAIGQLNEEQLDSFKKWIQDAIDVSGI